MKDAEEVGLLRKELDFIQDRWRRFQHDLNVYEAHGRQFIVNGVSRRDYSHRLYLDSRREKCLDRLRELRALTPAEVAEWEGLLDNWLPRILTQEKKDLEGAEWGDVRGWREHDPLPQRFIRAGYTCFVQNRIRLTNEGRQWVADRRRRFT